MFCQDAEKLLATNYTDRSANLLSSAYICIYICSGVFFYVVFECVQTGKIEEISRVSSVTWSTYKKDLYISNPPVPSKILNVSTLSIKSFRVRGLLGAL